MATGTRTILRKKEYEYRYVTEKKVDSMDGWETATKAEQSAQARTAMKKDPRTILIKREIKD